MELTEIKKIKNNGRRRRLLKEYRKEQYKKLIEENKQNEIVKMQSKKRKNVTYSKVKINGQEYLKNRNTQKLYGMPRTIETRTIRRNVLRRYLKEKGYSKVNKIMQRFWKDLKTQQILENGGN